MTILHNHQNNMVHETHDKLHVYQSVIMQGSTGIGKSHIASHIADRVVKKGKKAIFLVHRKELLLQSSNTFSEQGIDHGFIASGYEYDANKSIHIASIGTLKNRIEQISVPDLLVIDECHHSIASGWAKVINWAKAGGAKIIGLTATPWRLSGEGLKEHFSAMVCGPSMRWLIDNGYLSEYDLYGPGIFPDLNKIDSQAGDYVQNQLDKVMNQPVITGNAIEQYKELCDGKPAIVFCCSIQHAHDVAKQFNDAGYRFVTVDSHTPDEERKKANDDLRAGNIHGITNCAIYTEGVSVDRVECIILLRPTKSLTLFLQMIGRGLRTYPGKERCVILEHTGSVYNHLLPCTEREWSLEGRDKQKNPANPIPLRHCKDCQAIYSAKDSICPRCGSAHVIEHKEIKTVRGKLQKITPEDAALIAAAKKQKRVDVGRARTREELTAIARERGYKPSWIHFMMKNRKQKHA